MTNLDSIFKSRDITLPTKIRLVKAMVFPVVMYGCETWTVKKAECRRIDAFELWSLGFSRQEHWSGLPFPSPMHESAKAETLLGNKYPSSQGYGFSSGHVWM